mmetsp:Transcript_22599/g.59489  ORF Transcript_22599/g.59489 Transcript_22599/m.59489 type:complete len:321 (-) Transcript_22599:26-988(-)
MARGDVLGAQLGQLHRHQLVLLVLVAQPPVVAAAPRVRGAVLRDRDAVRRAARDLHRLLALQLPHLDGRALRLVRQLDRRRALVVLAVAAVAKDAKLGPAPRPHVALLVEREAEVGAARDGGDGLDVRYRHRLRLEVLLLVLQPHRPDAALLVGAARAELAGRTHKDGVRLARGRRHDALAVERGDARRRAAQLRVAVPELSGVVAAPREDLAVGADRDDVSRHARRGDEGYLDAGEPGEEAVRSEQVGCALQLHARLLAHLLPVGRAEDDEDAVIGRVHHGRLNLEALVGRRRGTARSRLLLRKHHLVHRLSARVRHWV